MPTLRSKRTAPNAAAAEAPAAKKAAPAKKPKAKEAEAEAKKVKETIESNGADASSPQGQGDIVVTIEHCKSWQVYKKKANEVVDFLQKELPEATFKLNPDKPRTKAFNIYVAKPGQEVKEEVWDGRTMGPPARKKWPELDNILALVMKAIE